MNESSPESIQFEVARNAELTLETSGNLLRKVVKEYEASSRTVDRWEFKELLRRAALHRLLTREELSRWLSYRDARIFPAHDYGEEFADHTLALIVKFQLDAASLHETLVAKHG